MSLSAIVATSKNGAIGVENNLPWRLPADLKYFKRMTTGKTVVMGRKTYESIGKPLPNRHNIVLTRDRKFEAEGCTIMNSVDEILNELSTHCENMIIGGEQIYKLFMPYIDVIYLTEVDIEVEGDAFFEVPNGFKVVSEENYDNGALDDGTIVAYTFKKLIRK